MKKSGFTTIELIITIIVIALLAVIALPKFLTRNNFLTETTQAQLIAQLRNTQIQALNDHSRCYHLLITNQQFGIPNSCSNELNTVNPEFLFNVDADIAIAIGSQQTLGIEFDQLGRPRNQECNNGCRITVTGSTTVAICLEQEGYIHACD